MLKLWQATANAKGEVVRRLWRLGFFEQWLIRKSKS
jgi:hypothetical protein